MFVEWSEWKSLDSLPDYRGYAVYRIRLCESGKVVSIPRFLDCDNQGILCIGKSKYLKKRLENFARSKETGRGHYEASRLPAKERLDKQFPNRTYEYSFLKLDLDNEQDGDEEARQIWAYFDKFGEVPPLNSNLPKLKKKQSIP